jgi:hydroxyacylglutathione hydrolase
MFVQRMLTVKPATELSKAIIHRMGQTVTKTLHASRPILLTSTNHCSLWTVATQPQRPSLSVAAAVAVTVPTRFTGKHYERFPTRRTYSSSTNSSALIPSHVRVPVGSDTTLNVFRVGGVVPANTSDRFELYMVPMLEDNYSYVIRDITHNAMHIVDPAEATPILALHQMFGSPAHVSVLCTHHHVDHCGGNQEIAEQTGCDVIGPARAMGITKQVATSADADGILEVSSVTPNYVLRGALDIIAFDVPGHTADHVAYYVPQLHALFCGDTLFSMGCGRLFEGTPQQMWDSMRKICSLPSDTWVFCGHEYTMANGKFCKHVSGSANSDLNARIEQVHKQRELGLPTVPTTLTTEMLTNAFLRPSDSVIRTHLGMDDAATDVEVFHALRSLKDSF